MLYDVLHEAIDIVRWFGLPLAVLAWLTVVVGVLAMDRVLRHVRCPGIWISSLAVGGLAFAGHAADIGVTIAVSPDLALEANPIWRSVVDTCGMRIAAAHALSGQFLVVVLSVQLFAWYLATRHRLSPAEDRGLTHYVLNAGINAPRRLGVRWPILASLFAFLFATLGPYFFYVAFLNAVVLTDLREVYPSPPAALTVYLLITTALYFVLGYGASRRELREEAAQPETRFSSMTPRRQL